MLDIARLIDWLSGTGIQEKSSSSSHSERRQFERLPLQDCSIYLGPDGPFPLLNLSFGGMRVDLGRYEKLAELKIGQELNCDIFLENILINNRIMIRNLENGLAGCAFAKFSATEARIVNAFLKPRILGFSLREIDNARLRNEDENLRMRWFQGKDGTQIFLWQTMSGENVKQEFYFLDYFIGWQNNQEDLKTGIIKESSKKSFGRLSPESVAFFNMPSYRALKLGRTILSSSRLPADAKDHLFKSITREEKRLYHRYVIKNNEVCFVPDQQPNLLIPVLNLSLQGIALLTTPDFRFDRKKQFSGTLQLATQQIRVLFKPAYEEAHFCGGSIEGDDEAMQKFSEFLAPRLLAQYLEKVPAPIEVPMKTGSGVSVSLFTGLHNTHVLSLVGPDAKLLGGRIVFMNNIVRYHLNSLKLYRCSESVIFPGDWDIPAHILHDEKDLDEQARYFCKELLENSQVADATKEAWLEALS
jgi:hypothetical protein